jgi:hypothetical protein
VREGYFSWLEAGLPYEAHPIGPLEQADDVPVVFAVYSPIRFA